MARDPFELVIACENKATSPKKDKATPEPGESYAKLCAAMRITIFEMLEAHDQTDANKQTYS